MYLNGVQDIVPSGSDNSNKRDGSSNNGGVVIPQKEEMVMGTNARVGFNQK